MMIERDKATKAVGVWRERERIEIITCSLVSPPPVQNLVYSHVGLSVLTQQWKKKLLQNCQLDSPSFVFLAVAKVSAVALLSPSPPIPPPDPSLIVLYTTRATTRPVPCPVVLCARAGTGRGLALSSRASRRVASVFSFR